MPKGKKIEKSSMPKDVTWFDMLAEIRLSESYVSLFLGVVVVVVLAVLLITTVQRLRQNAATKMAQQTSSISTVEVAPTKEVASASPAAKQESKPIAGSSYTVAAGDTLWSIALAKYNSGYNWVDIAKANNLSNPGDIHVGNKLVLPKLDQTIARTMAAPSQPPIADAIKGSTYTIKRGDDLWDIAVRAYGDGYRWVDIAKANKLENPSLIHSDNTLTIPR